MTAKGRTRLSREQVSSIKEMVAIKMSNGAIAVSLNLKKSTVAYVAAYARRADRGARKENRGRPKLLSPRALWGLRRLLE